MQAPLDFAPRRIRIDASSAPDDLVWFRDVYSREMARLEFEAYGDAPFVFDSTIRHLPGLALAEVAFSPMVTHRRRNADDEDHINLVVMRSGGALLRIGDSETSLESGMATFSRSGRPDSAASFAMRTNAAIFGLRLSRSLLAPLVDGYDDVRRTIMPAGSQPLRLLLAYLESLEQMDAIAEPRTRRLVAAHIADLAALVIGASGDGAAIAAQRGARAARLAAVKRDVADNIARPDLSEVAVAARHGISPRYLRRLFETEGVTFTEYVLAERLERAFRALSDPRQMSRTIGEIGLAAGFGDLSYFNRTFRRRYGDTPTGVRAALRRRS